MPQQYGSTLSGNVRYWLGVTRLTPTFRCFSGRSGYRPYGRERDARYGGGIPFFCLRILAWRALYPTHKLLLLFFNITVLPGEVCHPMTQVYNKTCCETIIEISRRLWVKEARHFQKKVAKKRYRTSIYRSTRQEPARELYRLMRAMVSP